MKKFYQKRSFKFYMFISPWLMGLVFFIAGPMIYSMYLSLTEYTLLNPPFFIGLENYIELFKDPRFIKSLKVTGYYTFVGVPLRLGIALAIAILLNKVKYGQNLLRTVFYLPSVVSGVAVVILWKWLFNPEIGLINYILRFFGFSGPGWLYDPVWALDALVIMSLWGVGGAIVIFLAGLQGIPDRLYEAAKIDGAGAWKTLRNITIPMLSSTIFFNLIMGVIGSFQVFTSAYVATEGGPLDSTLVTVLYLYKKAFGELQMGYASAMAWVLFAIILIFTLLVIRSSSLWVFYETEVKEGK